MAKDRRTFRAGKIEKQRFIRLCAEGCLLIEATGWLFFENPWIRMILLAALPLYIQYRMKSIERKDQEQYKEQIQNMLQSLSGAIETGYSLENAWKEVYREMLLLYGKEKRVCKEVQIIMQRVDKNEPIEHVIEDFAQRSGIEDLKLFADIVQFAKRSGGNFSKIIRGTVLRMTEKGEVDREIRTMTAGKRIEQRIMCIMPAGMILYLRLASPGYLNVMYSTVAGELIMGICLAGYAVAFVMGERITEIQV